MHLQTPVPPSLSLIRVDIILFAYFLCWRTRIPYTELTVFVFTASLGQHVPFKDSCTPTSKKDQVFSGLWMVCRTVHSILSYLRPRDNLHVLQSRTQCSNFGILFLAAVEHKGVPIPLAPRISC